MSEKEQEILCSVFQVSETFAGWFVKTDGKLSLKRRRISFFTEFKSRPEIYMQKGNWYFLCYYA